MDNCMTCKDRPCCPMYDEYGSITGCWDWKPVDRLESDELYTASGIILGLAISIPIWILIIWLFVK